MADYEASRTAVYVALYRALESLRPGGERLFHDPLANSFLPARLRLVVAASRIPLLARGIAAYMDRRWPGPRAAAIARTRVIDDALRDALGEGIDQLVILGAGFDTRAHRIPELQRSRVFEVDHPGTAAVKRERIAAMVGQTPEHVVYVEADLAEERLADALARGGFDAGRPAFFIWEGVTNYLTAEAVDATLRYVGGTAPGSGIVFTYVHRGLIDGTVEFEGGETMRASVRGMGEPWRFGFDPGELADYLAVRGLRLVEDQDSVDYRARLMGPSGHHLRGYAFYRTAMARTAS